MKVDETKQTDQVSAQDQELSDLPVDNEQANGTKGGLNYQAIKFDYRPQDDKDT